MIILLGIISVPISMSLPGAWWRSGYSKALSAKEQLLKIIEAQLKSNPSMYVKNHQIYKYIVTCLG